MKLLLQRLLNRRRAERVSRDRIADRYRCVVIFKGSDIQAGSVTTKHHAMQQWRWRIASGGYSPASGLRALVMTDTDYRHMAGGAA